MSSSRDYTPYHEESRPKGHPQSEYTRVAWTDEIWNGIRAHLEEARAPLPPPGEQPMRDPEGKPTKRMLLEMISILDGFERLISLADKDSIESTPLLKNWMTSIRGLHRRMSKALERLGVRPAPSVGRPFDAHLHEAVEVRQDPRFPPGTVIEVREKPYRWGGQTLRVGKVVVTPKAPRKSPVL